MLSKNYKLSLSIFYVFFSIMGMVFSHPAYAAINFSTISLDQMLNNLATNDLPAVMQFVTAFAYVMGMFFMYKGMYALKQYGEQRTMMSSSHDIKGPLIYLFVGAALLYLPTTVMYSLGTFFTVYPYSYVDDTANTDPYSLMIQSIFVILQLIGTLAFIRGLVLLSSLANQAQHGTFGRALAHMIGGIFLINIYGFINVIIYSLYGQTL